MKIALRMLPVVIVASLLTASTALAHHSFGMFDKSVEKVATGTVARWAFNVPHSWLYLNVKNPDGTETLVARQLFRPAVGSSKQVFQLHPTGHLFAPGHVAKLELLPSDSHGALVGGYGRASNGQGPVTVSGLELRLPVLEGPGGGQVKPALPKLLPCGASLAQFSGSHSVPLRPAACR